MSYSRVFFDCDSTLSTVEGIDELARRAGVGEAMARLTAGAMSGATPLEAIYARRLDLIRPRQTDLDWLADRYIEQCVAGAVETISELLHLDKQVHIISGGLRQAILPLALALGIAPERVHAVTLLLDPQGEYAGFDSTSPLARSGGKAKVCRELLAPGDRAVMVGDGITDAETLEAGVDFIGFGGVVVRETVRARATHYVSECSLLASLPYILTTDELQLLQDTPGTPQG